MSSVEDPATTTAGAAYAVAAYGIWGIAPMYWKQLAGVPAAEILAHRVLWSLVVGVGLVLVTRRRAELGRVLRSRRGTAAMATSALLIGTNWGVFLWAVETNRVLDTSLGYYINPLINVLFGMLLLGERLRPAQIAAVLLAAAGVAQLAFALGSLPWISLVLAGSFALYGLVRKVAPVQPVVGFTVEAALLAPIGAVWLWSSGAVGSGALASGSALQAAFLVGGGAFTAAPLLCFNSAAKRLPLSTVGLFQFLAPTLAFLLAVALYDEPFTRAHAVTFGCVWLALGVYVLDSARAARGL